MTFHSIAVKIIKETASKLTIHFLSSNSQMVVNKQDFERRLEDGIYDLRN